MVYFDCMTLFCVISNNKLLLWSTACYFLYLYQEQVITRPCTWVDIDCLKISRKSHEFLIHQMLFCKTQLVETSHERRTLLSYHVIRSIIAVVECSPTSVVEDTYRFAETLHSFVLKVSLSKFQRMDMISVHFFRGYLQLVLYATKYLRVV